MSSRKHKSDPIFSVIAYYELLKNKSHITSGYTHFDVASGSVASKVMLQRRVQSSLLALVVTEVFLGRFVHSLVVTVEEITVST